MDANRNLWGDCAAWLTRCKVIPAETKIYQNLPNSAVELLARTLRDGVLLCNLLSYLDDSSIEEGDIIQKSQMSEIHCVQNISLFLQICKHYYGLCESDLFDPMMLFDMRNFRKVLSTLSKLSRCTRVTQLHPNLRGFDVPIVSDELNAGLKAVYMNLEATTISKTIEPLDKNLRLSKAEIVYQKLCSAQPQQLSGQRKTRTKRDYVINELVGTETNYLGVLHALRDSFMKPLSAVLSEDELRTIFPCIPELVEIHEHFLDRLRDATSTSPSVQISEVFLHACKPFLVYGEYLSSISDPFKTLEGILSKNTDFKRILNQCQLHNNCNGVQLHEILTVPMQRFLKYPLLLRALIAETPNTHVDFRGLKAAKKAMIELAEYTNAVKSDSENLEIIQMVKERVVGLKLPEGNDLKMYGLLLHHGELSIGTVEEKEVRNVYAFIFHKLLILVEQTTPIKISNYTFRESHNLADFKVESCNNKYFTIGRDGKSRHQMRLIHKSTSAAITFYMKSAAELNQWENALNEAIYVLQPFGTTTTDHKFTITSYTEPTVCDHCSKFLNGLIHQGYRCSGCTISVHRSCISSTGRCKNNTTIPERKTFRNHPFSEFYWFVGEMDRNRATKQLRHRKIGTYLLRVRKQGVVNVAETIYALSLKTVKREIRHIKIYQTRDESATLLYYLSNNQQFRSIEDLVSFYEQNELGEIFNGLNQRLQWPFRGVLATALYDFSPCESIQSNQLALREGCLVLVIAKMGDSNGWWRGKSMGYVGYFPKDFVRVDRPSNFQL